MREYERTGVFSMGWNLSLLFSFAGGSCSAIVVVYPMSSRNQEVTHLHEILCRRSYLIRR